MFIKCNTEKKAQTFQLWPPPPPPPNPSHSLHMRSSRNGKAKHTHSGGKTLNFLPLVHVNPGVCVCGGGGDRRRHARRCSRVSFITLEGCKRPIAFFFFFFLKGLWRGGKKTWRTKSLGMTTGSHTLRYAGAENKNNILIYLWKRYHHQSFPPGTHGHVSSALASRGHSR